MRAYTITCHNCYNYGATLQSYALQQFLLSLGVEHRIIDYVPWYMDYAIRYKRIPQKWNTSFARKVLYCATHHPQIAIKSRRRKKFDLFTHEKLALTKRYRSYMELKEDPPRGQLYICGSDQIWNGIDYNNGRDPAFFIGFVSDSKCKKISYAASFGRENVYEGFLEDNGGFLKEFSEISVRESNGISIANSLGFVASQVVDPVFLLDKNDWLKLIKPSKRKRYILIYSLDDAQKPIELYKKYSEKYDVISIGEIKIPGTHYIRDCGPVEFLQLIYEAEYIITNSFHCVAFSIIFDKKFTVFERSVGTNSRIKSLMKLMQLGEEVYENNINKRLDYSMECQSFQKMLNYSKEFLKKYIK